MTVLSAVSLSLRLGQKEVLSGVDLDLREGSLTLLAGRNGAGKTTLLSALAGLLCPDHGEVRIGGIDVGTIAPRDRARELTLIPQEAESPFEFSGRELVMMGRHMHIPRFRGPGVKDLAAVDEAIALVDATAFVDRSVRTLSGGERQRIGIARALATRAPILLADEPTANLDLEHALAVMGLFQRLAREGYTVVVASHDLNMVAPFADAVILLHEGRIRFDGCPEEAFAAELVEEVFGVRSFDPDGFFPRTFRS
ncbi:MAG: ABC transporter ATP-binding protein [Planctomycetota bacterium]|jgi:iron complex transport system ATP-binding protein|nr:ABC transporter ATP-binding protein [Planctomycetota bacterium]